MTLVLYVLWLWIGIGWRLDGEVHDDYDGGMRRDSNGRSNGNGACPAHVGNWVDADIVWGFVFLTALLWMLIVSFFVACCCDSGKDYSSIVAGVDEEQMVINGGNQRNNNGQKIQKKQKQYGTVVPSSLAAVAVAIPTPSAPPYDSNVPVATATPVNANKC